jgi:hypothetical protein
MSDVVTHWDTYELTKDVSHTHKANLASASMSAVGKSVAE